MATTRKSPKKYHPVEPITGCAAWHQTRSFAFARKRKWFTITFKRTIRAAKARVKARRPSDEPSYNAETLEAIRKTDAGIGVTRYKSAADMYADLGI